MTGSPGRGLSLMHQFRAPTPSSELGNAHFTGPPATLTAWSHTLRDFPSTTFETRGAALLAGGPALGHVGAAPDLVEEGVDDGVGDVELRHPGRRQPVEGLLGVGQGQRGEAGDAG